MLEALERRDLLSAAPWQNPVNSRDVNFDHRVSGVDVLAVVNDLLAHGPRTLDAQAAPLAAAPGERLFYVDVSGDNRVSGLDVLMVVNELLDEELMLVETIATDLSDNPITTIGVGEQFKLRTFVQDVRDPAAPIPGVFSAAIEIDLDMPSGIASFDTGEALVFDPFFSGFTVTTLLDDQAIGYGLHTGQTMPGNDPQFFFSAIVTADAPGTLMITPTVDPNPDHENAMLEQPPDVLVLMEDQIFFETTELTITGPTPTISINDVSQPEASGPFNFEVRLSSPSAESVEFEFRTLDDTAMTSDNDYDETTGQLTFAPMQTLLTIPVTVNDDPFIEDDEQFIVELFNVDPVVNTGKLQGIGTIVNDDSPAELSISDATVTAGPIETVAVFTVTLSGAIDEEVTVGFATEDDSAMEGIHYEAQTGNLSFDPGGATTQEIHVTILPNTMPQEEKRFFVNLSSQMPPEVVIADSQGIGTIVSQGLMISDASVVEGNAGTALATFTVTLSQAAQGDVTVFYQTADGPAPNGATVADNDYEPASGTLTFTPSGEQAQTITVEINGDMTPEANERFFVNLSEADGAPLFDSQGVGTIINDDGDAVVYRLEATDLSGAALPLDESIDVGEDFLLRVFVQDVRDVADATGVAQAALDVMYQSNLVMPVGNPMFGPFYSTTFTFFNFEDGLLDDFGAFGMTAEQPDPPSAELLLFQQQFVATDVGQVHFVGSVQEEDLNQELGHETLVYGPPGTPPEDLVVPSEQINLVPEDLPLNIGENVITVSNASGPESGGTLVFVATRFLPDNTEATVVYSTQNGTATAGEDYEAQNGTLTFAPGETEPQLITISLIDDALDEPDETFFLTLSNEMNAAVSEVPATGTIEDDDGPVSVSVAGAVGPEGSHLLFTVSLSAESGKEVTVNFTTDDAPSGILATEGVDYTPTSGVLVFAPGTVQQVVSVEALSDIEPEPDEVFQLVLSSPANADLGTAQAQGTITDEPPAGISGHVYVDLDNDGVKDPNETGIGGVLITATRSDGVTETTLTGEDGFYSFLTLFPGTYTIEETQPGFFNDGRDTRFGMESPFNDRFVGVELTASESVTGYNFGERGVRAEFIAAFINRRALFASATVTGFQPALNVPGTVLDLGTGEVWVSFDGGWDGVRAIEAHFNNAQGSATMRLYDNSLQEIANSAATSFGASLIYNGNSGLPYFLRISGTNRNVAVVMTEIPLPSSLVEPGEGDQAAQDPAADSASSASDVLSPAGRFASAQLMTAPLSEPLASSDASDEALAEDEDWLLETLLA